MSWITGRNEECGSQEKDKYKKIWVLSLVTSKLCKVPRNTDMYKHISRLDSKFYCNRIYNAHRNMPMSEQKGGRVIARPILKLIARRGRLDDAMPRTLQPREYVQVPNVDKAWWVPEPVWTSLEKRKFLASPCFEPRPTSPQTVAVLIAPSQPQLQFTVFKM